MAKFDNQDWDKVPFYRKRVWVFVRTILFWPIALLSVLTGRVYRKTPEGTRAVSEGLNIAVATLGLCVLFALAIVVGPTQNSSPTSGISCKNTEKTAISAIEGGAWFHLLHIKVISNSKPVRLSKDGKGIHCQMTAILSNAKTVTIKYHTSPDPNHRDQTLVTARVVQQ